MLASLFYLSQGGGEKLPEGAKAKNSKGGGEGSDEEDAGAGGGDQPAKKRVRKTKAEVAAAKDGDVKGKPSRSEQRRLKAAKGQSLKTLE